MIKPSLPSHRDSLPVKGQCLKPEQSCPSGFLPVPQPLISHIVSYISLPFKGAELPRPCCDTKYGIRTADSFTFFTLMFFFWRPNWVSEEGHRLCFRWLLWPQDIKWIRDVLSLGEQKWNPNTFSHLNRISICVYGSSTIWVPSQLKAESLLCSSVEPTRHKVGVH